MYPLATSKPHNVFAVYPQLHDSNSFEPTLCVHHFEGENKAKITEISQYGARGVDL